MMHITNGPPIKYRHNSRSFWRADCTCGYQVEDAPSLEQIVDDLMVHVRDETYSAGVLR